MVDDCPYCEYDLEEWFREHREISCYGDEFNCPKCNGRVERKFEESWDGEEEHQYYWLSKVENKT